MKKEMTAEELARYGFIYFEDGLWKRDVLLWRDCCGSVRHRVRGRVERDLTRGEKGGARQGDGWGRG